MGLLCFTWFVLLAIYQSDAWMQQHPSMAWKKINTRSGHRHPLHLLVSTVAVDKEKAYDAEAITVLKGLEPVRKRPGMYIGSTGVKGLHHLVFEVVDNSVDEALAGHCTDIYVTLHSDGSVEVADNGRGIPCSVHPSTGKSTLETVLCVLHAGGKFGGDESGYKVSGGLHGVGISVVNALSSSLIVEVVRDNTFHTMSFSQGEPLGDMTTRPALPSEQRGTRVRFVPDPTIFKTSTEFELERLEGRFDELAYLNAGLSIHVKDLRREDVPETRVFRHDGGVRELVEFLCADKTCLHTEHPLIHTTQSYRQGNVETVVEVALRWSKDQFAEQILGFANGIRTGDGGSHLDGLKAAVTKVVNQIAKKVDPHPIVLVHSLDLMYCLME